MRTKIFYPVIAGAVLALGGCETIDSMFQTSTTVPDNGANRSRTEGVMPGDPAIKPGMKPRFVQPAIDPKDFLEKNQDQVVQVLGSPKTVKDAAPATIWHYAASDCSLDLFFYMDLATKSLRVLSYDSKIGNGAANDATAARCVGQIQTANRTQNR